MRKYLSILLGSLVVFLCWAKPDFIYRYWFDNSDEKAVVKTSTETSIHIDADVSSLSESIHALNIQIFDGDKPGALRSSLFIKSPSTISGEGIRYWFDNDYESGQIISTRNAVAGIDVGALREGIHMLHVQSAGVEPSPTRSAVFIKMPQVIGVEYLKCVSYVDGKIYRTDNVDPNQNLVHYDMPIADIAEGLHTLSIQLVMPSGATSEVKNCYFLRLPTGNEISRMRCYYSIDGLDGRQEAGVFDNGDFHFDIDVKDVREGLHSINYMLVGENGRVTEIKTGLFYKIPLGGYKVIRYWYWVNDDEANKTEVEINESADGLNITELLPVPTIPLRSSQFHFEFNSSGVPYIYASNDFHFRTLSNDYRTTERCQAYTDYSISKKVTDVTKLTGSGMISKPIPSSNSIKWFKINAAIGDSITLRAHTPCTIDVFDPKGKQVKKSEGFNTMKTFGFHTYEEGDYYIAMHEVPVFWVETTMYLDYEHINKYAVLSYTPNEFGAKAGYIHVDLVGNGCDKLVNARIKCGNTELWSNNITATDYAHATIEYYIPNDNIQRGQYDILLDFDDGTTSETLSLSKAITLTDPILGGIEIETSSPLVSGDTRRIMVTVKNKGNVEYDMVPLYFAYDNPDAIKKVRFMDFTVMASKESVADGLKGFYTTDNLLGKNIDGVFVPALIPTLKGYESQTYTIEIESKLGYLYNFYSWAYRPWSLGSGGKGSALGGYGSNNGSGSGNGSGNGTGSGSGGSGTGTGNNSGSGSGSGSGSSGSGGTIVGDDDPLTGGIEDLCSVDPCDVGGAIGSGVEECLCAIGVGIGETLAGIYNGAHIMNYNAQGAEYERDTGGSWGDVSPTQPRRHLPSPGGILHDFINHCVPLPDGVSKTLAIAGLLTPDNNCPAPQPQQIQTHTPVDPNDILGYTAPSGSLYVKRGIEYLPYVIEFENDPEFATSSAHHIVITNKLDGNKFDLSTFNPKGMKLSNKEVTFDGSQNFVYTLDMRPEINSLAQVTLTYDAATGEATFDILALDPMTLEPTNHVMQGILPVNDSNDSGIGEIYYDIKLKDGLTDGATISNSATITFDTQDPIATPVWQNTLDYVNPSSRVARAVSLTEGNVLLTIEGSDARSGIWKYDIYSHKPDANYWTLVAEGAEPNTDSEVTLEIDADSNLEFCSIAYDMAGNAESKDFAVEATLAPYLIGDANNDGMVTIADYTVIINSIIGKPTGNLLFDAADIDGDGQILIADATSLINIVLGKTSSNAPARNNAPAQRRFSIDDMTFDADGTATSTVRITKGSKFTAAQFDIELPDGIELVNASLIGENSATHDVRFTELAQGIARVVVYSPTSENFAGDEILTLTFATNASMTHEQTLFLNQAYVVECTDAGVIQLLSAPATALAHQDTSGISDANDKTMEIWAEELTICITCTVDTEVTVTDIAGRSATYNLKAGTTRIDVGIPGAYLVNNHKIIVK